MEKVDKKIVMIGPECQGGITSVIHCYYINGFNHALFMPTYHGKNKLYNYISFLIKFACSLIDSKTQLIHIHSASRGSFLRKAICFYLAKISHKKVIFHIHGAEFKVFYDTYPSFIKTIITDVLNKSDLILVLSKQWQNNIESMCSNANIKVLYNPTTIKELKEKQASESINVLFMGRLGQRKGVYDIIEATKLIKNSNIKITLYGDGETEKIQKLIDENNLSDKLTLGGWISGDDVDKAYRNADIYILPSYNEGLPMSILEAMSYGLPIISTPVGGTPEAVEENANGYLLEAGDYKGLAEKIELLADNKTLREQMGQQSYNIAQEKFDINVILDHLKKIYNELLPDINL